MKSASSALRHFKANAIQIRDSARIEQTLSERLDCFSSAYVSSPDTARNGTLPYTILTNPDHTQVHTMDATVPSAKLQTGLHVRSRNRYPGVILLCRSTAAAMARICPPRPAGLNTSESAGVLEEIKKFAE